MTTPGGGHGPRWDEEAQHWMGEGTEPPAPGGGAPWPYQGVVLLSVLAVLLVGGIGFGVWKLVDGDGGDDPVRSGSTASAEWPGGDGVPVPSASPSFVPSSEPSSAPSSVSPSVSSDGGPDAGGAPPAGYARTRDPEGFTLDVPVGWQRVKRDTGVFYESSDASSLIQVFALTEPEVTPYEALRKAETGLKQSPGYHRYRLERLGPGAGADAELEYGYRSEKFGKRRILDRAFSGRNGVQYAVLVAGPAEDWPDQRKRQGIVLNAFCPTAYCPAGSDTP
ncbi:hypothetical protein [Streptomyces sp. NPDC048636]|uniref:hypothetical protein n=1 Tax=Streptomyces sp. NPDC048636 TaxID=3155762 RepID=UPI00343F9A2D